MYRTTRTLLVLLFLLTGIARPSAQVLETGPAGVYDTDQRGTRTALGYIYDPNQLTCAHKFHPSGSNLRITRIDNGQSVVVEVTDRLSARADEVAVLSTAAARLLNIVPDRIAIVQIENLGGAAALPQAYYNTSPRTVQSYERTARSAPLPEAYDAPPPQPAATITDRSAKLALPNPFNPSPEATPPPQSYDYLNRTPSLTPKGIPQNYEATTPRATVVPRGYDAAPSEREALYYVQTAAFADYDNAQRYIRNLLRRGISDARIVQAQKPDGSVIYRSRIGPYANAAIAKTQKEYLAREFQLTGLIVKGY